MEKVTIEQEIASMLEVRKAEIITKGIDGVQEEIQSQIRWKLGNVVSTQIEELFNDDDVQAKLSEEINKVKITFVEQVAKALARVAPKIATELAINLQKRAIKNLTEDSYSMRDVYKKIFD